MVSTRAQIITRRTYNRPLDEEGKTFETWAQTVARVIDHQEWLWTRAVGGRELTDVGKPRPWRPQAAAAAVLER